MRSDVRLRLAFSDSCSSGELARKKSVPPRRPGRKAVKNLGERTAKRRRTRKKMVAKKMTRRRETGKTTVAKRRIEGVRKNGVALQKRSPNRPERMIKRMLL